MKLNEIVIKNHRNNNFRLFHNNNSSSKILPNNKFKKEIPLTTNIFKNYELQKSLSINISNNNKFPSNYSESYNNILNNKNSFLTTIPITQNRGRNYLPIMQEFNLTNKNISTKTNSYYVKKKKNKEKFELKFFNDERCFSSKRKTKPFKNPKAHFIISQYRVNHDTNIFNLKHVLTDYTKNYERDSYKIKKVVQNDMFVNKIKNDLLKLKFNNRIKPFDDL